jgi:hypothetical protein
MEPIAQGQSFEEFKLARRRAIASGIRPDRLSLIAGSAGPFLSQLRGHFRCKSSTASFPSVYGVRLKRDPDVSGWALYSTPGVFV